jgi:DNA-binding transcriptional LysR family regulator
VLRREAEFGINIAGSHHPELRSEPLTEDRFVLVCRRDHPLADRATTSWRELESYRLIFAGEVSGNRPLLDGALAGLGLAIDAFYEVQRSSTALGLVAAGVAAAVVPRLALQKSAYPRLRVVALADPVVSRSLVLVSRRNAHLSPAAQALYDMVLATRSSPPVDR